MSEWSDFLSRTALRAHELWLENGRSGDGQLVLQDCDLSAARSGGKLDGARLIRCNCSQAQFELSSMQEIELTACQFHESSLRGCDLTQAQLRDCSFTQSNLKMIDLIEGNADSCDFSGSFLERSSWNDSRLHNCRFGGAELEDATFDGARFEDCDFRGAALTWSEGPPLGTAVKTHFVRCDFRGANFEKLRIDGALFDQCAFFGVKGKPTVKLPCLFINCDYSEGYDGTLKQSGKAPW